MDPVSIGVMGAVSLGSTLIGGLTKAQGQEQQAQAESEMYQYQSGVAQMNQKIALQNADYARYAGEVEAQQSGMQARFQIGQTRATQGASGLDVGSGSALRVQESEHTTAVENMGLIRSNAAKAAYGYEVEAVQAGAQSTLDQMAASKSLTAGKISAAGTLIGTAGSLASGWLGMQKAGVFGGGTPVPTGA